MVDALSRRPRVNVVSIAYNHDLVSMIDKYANDVNFSPIYQGLMNGNTQEPYSLNEVFLLHGSRLCIVKDLREKVMYESHSPPYAGHRGILATTQAIETYFFWLGMRQDIQDYVTKCIVCTKRSSMIEGKLQDCYSLYQFLKDHGKVFQWILSSDYQNPYKEILAFGR